MIAEDEIAAKAARILRELPEHPAPRRFCFAGWELHDYQRLEARIGRAGIPAFRRILPDVSILIGPPSPACALRIR
jgi:hypothetical protein